MWGNEHGNKLKAAKVDTLVGHKTQLTGDLVFQGGLHLDGTVKGNVIAEDGTDSLLILSEQGCIEGEVRVPNMLINGRVIGDVYASGRVELASRSRISGNVYYNLLEMAIGAEVNGNLMHRKKPQKSKVGEAQVVAPKPVVAS